MQPGLRPAPDARFSEYGVDNPPYLKETRPMARFFQPTFFDSGHIVSH